MARLNEKVRAQGPLRSMALISLRNMEESSSARPPLRKTTPGMEGGMDLSRVWTVRRATSLGLAFSLASTPLTVMAGLRRDPSR